MSTTTATVAMATTEISTITTSEEILEDEILKHIRETSTFNHIHAMVKGGGWLIISLDHLIEDRAEFLKCVEKYISYMHEIHIFV